MPRDPPTHTSHRQNVCAFYLSGKLFQCAPKAKLILNEGDVNCKKIHEYVSASFDPSKAKYPSGLCSLHKKALQLIDIEKDSTKKKTK